MATYKELQDQIAKLQMDAEEARSKEIEGALGQIKALMEEYRLTAEDIGSLSKKKSQKASQRTSVQFKDDAGNTWSGRGRMPAWLKGKDKEQFRVR
jgi:DNA-binding protein H-NS